MKKIRNDTYFAVVDKKTMQCLGTNVIQAEPVTIPTGATSTVQYLCEIKLDEVIVINENV